MRIKVIFLAVVVSISAFAQTLPKGVEKKASIGGLTEYDYPNGLRVVLIPDSSSPKITVNMTYLVGSRHEGYGESGMAHLLEHMNFIRSTHDRDMKKELSDKGAEWNGTTSFDRTNYFETFTASEDNLKWALGFEAERMVNMRIEKELLDREMTVVRNEFERGENSPERILGERVSSTAYLWHNYGKSTIGSRADIEKVPIDRLADFYRKYYQPDNAVLVIAGQFDEAKALDYVAQTCGAIPRPARKLEEPYTVEPVQDGERYIELRRAGNSKDIIVAWHGPAFSHPDSAALEVLSGIMESPGGTGRLYKALVDNKKAVSVSMGNEEMHDPALIMASARLSKDQSLDDARKTIEDTVSSVISEPPTKEEVEKVKSRILQGMDTTMRNSQRLAMDMTESVASGDWRLFFLNYDEIKAVTPEEVVRVAKLYLKDSNRTVGEFIPTDGAERTTVPDAPDYNRMLQNYKSGIALSQGESFDPSPANVEKHLTRTQLPSGLKIVTLSKETRGGTVTAVMQLHFGDEKSLVGKRAVSGIAGSLLMRGTKRKTRQQIQDEMVRLDARVNVNGGLSEATASIQTTAANLIPALRLAAEILREPSFPDAEFDQAVKRRITGLEEQKADPDALARTALQRNLNPWPKTDVRYVPSIDEEIEATKTVTLDEVKKFYAQYYGVSHAELAVVGQFNTDELRKTAGELFGSWTSPSPYERIVNTYMPTTPVNLKIETPDKQNANFEAGLNMSLTDKDPDYPALVLANYIFGGSPASRLFTRIRSREGLSYGVNSGFSAPFIGDLATFRAMAISNPANAPKVETSFVDELKTTVAKGFTPAEVEAAKKAIRDERTVGRSQDGQLTGILAVRADQDRTMKWDEDMDAKLQALTTDRVNAALKRHVDPAALSIVKAGDYKTAGVYAQ